MQLLLALGLLGSPVFASGAENAAGPAIVPAARDEQHIGDAIGAIEGDSIAVTGPMSVETVAGKIKTVLRSGADIRVKSGTARIELVEGGQITICGPAHLSVLKAGGALTVALDTGTIHVYIEREPALTIYTAQIKAQPVPIGDGAQDMLIGLDASGAMCVHATRGALRLEHQLTSQSMIIPQNADVQFTNGQLESLRKGAGTCACESQLAAAATSSTEISRLATSEEIRNAKPTLPASHTEKNIAPALKEEPIYTVIVPPLVYDAKATVQPEIDPKKIILIRRVHVRPTLIFQGRVEGEVVAAAAHLPPSPSPAPAAAVTQPATKKPATPANDSVVDRVRKFVRRLWSSGS